MTERKGSVFCMFCKKAVTVAEYTDHEKSEQHQTILKAKLVDISIGSMMCKSCMVPVNSEVIWKSHSNGRNHKKQVNFLIKVGKKQTFDRPFSLLNFDKDVNNPVTDKMFSVVPDLFAPLIDEPTAIYQDTVTDKLRSEEKISANEPIANISSTMHAANPITTTTELKPAVDELCKRNINTISEASKDVEANYDLIAVNASSKKASNLSSNSANLKSEQNDKTKPGANFASKLLGKEKLTAQQIKDNESQKRIEERRRHETERKSGRGRSEEVDNKFSNRGRSFNRGRFDNMGCMPPNRGRPNTVNSLSDTKERSMDISVNDVGQEKTDDLDTSTVSKKNQGVHLEIQSKESANVDMPDIDRKRKSRWDIKEKVISKQEYNTLADEFLIQHTKEKIEINTSNNPSTITNVQASTAPALSSTPTPPASITTALPPQVPGAPLIPPHGVVFSSIDPYASCPPIFNPPQVTGFPPGMPLPPNMPLPSTMLLPLKMSNMLLPPNMPLPPNIPFPPNSLPISIPSLPPPLPAPATLPLLNEDDELENYIKVEPFVNRGDIDNTPNPSVSIEMDPSEVEIFIPEFFAERYPDHPQKGVTKADPDVALKEALEKIKRAREPLVESIHLQMFTMPILKLNEKVGHINIDDYPSLRGQVKPIIKPNQKFVVIGSNCIKVTGPNHFFCELCRLKFNDSTKTEHLLSKPHLLNILWNWDPESAQLIRDIESLNKTLFEKKVMEAANEIQKKEIKLLSELQLRIRARILDENVEEQNKYFIKNDIFNPKDFPNHDFSYLKRAEDDMEEDEDSEEETGKPNKLKILEAGIMNILKSKERSEIVCDEDTAVAALGICRKIVSKLERRFKNPSKKHPIDAAEKIKKIKHFFNNLLIIQQILDVYPSAVKENAAKAKHNSDTSYSDESKREYPAVFSTNNAQAQTSIDQAQTDIQAMYYSKSDQNQSYPFSAPDHMTNYNQYTNYPNQIYTAPTTSQDASNMASSDPRRMKQSEGYSLYSESVDQAGLEWYRQNKLAP